MFKKSNFLLIFFVFFLLTSCTNDSNSNYINSNDIASISGNIYNLGLISEKENKIYYLDLNNAALYKANTDGQNKEKISEGNFSYLNVVDDWIFYIDSIDDNIYKINANGQDKQKICEDNATELIAFMDKLYFINRSKKGLYSIDYDGLNMTSICDGDILNVMFYNDYIYYVYNNNEHNLWRADKDGNNKELIVDEVVYKFFIFNNSIFYLDRNRDIQRTTILGQDKVSITKNSSILVESINIYNNTLYYSTPTMGGSFHSINLETSQDNIIHTGVYVPLYIINNQIFYYDKIGQLFCMDLSGDNARKW